MTDDTPLTNEAADQEAGYELVRCPDGRFCLRDYEYAHPCDRDEHDAYICERADLSCT